MKKIFCLFIFVILNLINCAGLDEKQTLIVYRGWNLATEDLMTAQEKGKIWSKEEYQSILDRQKQIQLLMEEVIKKEIEK